MLHIFPSLIVEALYPLGFRYMYIQKITQHKMGQSSIRVIVPTTNKIKIIKNQIPIAIRNLPFCSSHIMHPNFFGNQKQSSSTKLKSTIKSSFSNTMPFLISRYSLIDLGLFVHPKPRLSGQFFITRTNLFKFLIPSQQHFTNL